MTVDIGFWKRDEEGNKLQIHFRVFGGNIEWSCKRGHFFTWEPYGPPTDEDWEAVIREAEKRVPRRLIHQKMIELIRRRGERG